MLNKNRFLSAVLKTSLSLVLFSAIEAGAADYTISQIYKLAKAKDPAVQRAEARLAAASADSDIVFSSLLPKVSANGSVRQLWHRVLEYSSKPVEGEYTGYSYGIGGTIYLLNMPSYYSISAADAGIKSSEVGQKQTNQELLIRISDASFRYLKAAADVRLYVDELARVDKIREQAESFLAAGTGDVISVYEAKARVDSANADVIKARGLLNLAKQNLETLAGVQVDSVQAPKNGIAIVNKEELKWWIDTMEQNSTAIKQAKYDLLQAEKTTKSNTAAHYPTIQGNGGYTVDKGSTFLPKVETEQWYAGVGISIPIYGGGETVARERRAAAAENERRAMLLDAKEQGLRRVSEAYINVDYVSSMQSAYKKKLESAEVQLQAVQKGRSINTRTAIDLLNAEQSAAIARRDLVSASYDTLQKQLELKAAAGILTENDVELLSSELK